MRPATDNFDDWLEDAVPLGVYRSKSTRLRRLVDAMFPEIAGLVKVSSQSRQKDALKTILLNLYHARECERPIRYSRNKNDYTRDRRYGQLHFKYDRILPLIDALEQLGYVEQRTGFYYREDDNGKQTRCWGTDKLWDRFAEFGLHQPVFFQPVPAGGDEVVILRNQDKHPIGYRETAETRRMRRDLKRYNEFVGRHRVSLRLNANAVVDFRFLTELRQHILNGSAWVRSVRFTMDSPIQQTRPVPVPNFTAHLHQFNHNPVLSTSNLLDIPGHNTTTNPTTITDTKWRIATLRMRLRRFLSDEHRFEKFIFNTSFDLSRIPLTRRLKVLAKPFPLEFIGVEALEIVLEQENLHRIFNRKSWHLGGRAYGALHQDFVRREMRPLIFIDGEPTTEVDFSAYHIRMLYHREGIDYRDDPYLVCEGEPMRKNLQGGRTGRHQCRVPAVRLRRNPRRTRDSRAYPCRRGKNRSNRL